MEVDDLHLYLKCHSSRGVSQNFASKKQLPGFYISGTLVKNGLITSFYIVLNSIMKVSIRYSVSNRPNSLIPLSQTLYNDVKKVELDF